MDAWGGRERDRSVAERVDDALPALPGYEGLKTAGEMGALVVVTLRGAVTPPYRWGGDFLTEAAKMLRVVTVPLVVSTVLLAIGGITIYFGAVTKALGIIDRMGLAVQLAVVRESSMWLTGMAVAGVVGTAITADIGARKIRGELDAITVLGLDPIRKLVVPRVVAMTVVMPIVGIFVYQILVFCAGIGIVTYHSGSVTLAGYWDNANATIWGADWLNAIAQFTVAGFFISIVSCHKGLSVSGGAEGVGRAVNQAVLITFLGVFIVHILVNLVYYALFPDVLLLRA